MIKLHFEEIVNIPEISIELYSSINAIPFSIAKYSEFPSTIYCRSLTNEVFIEFRFRESDKALFETTLVTAQTGSVETVPTINLGKVFNTKF